MQAYLGERYYITVPPRSDIIWGNGVPPHSLGPHHWMTPIVEFSKCSVNVIHVVKFIFRNIKSCKHDMHEKYT